MAHQSEKNGAARPRPWVRIVLIVSLAFNLLVLGLIGGALLSGGKWRHHHPPRLEAGGPLTRALSNEDRRAIGRKMRKAYREDGEEVRASRHQALDELVAAVEAVPFDPEAVRQRMADIRAMFRNRFELGQTLLIERLSEMSDAERAAYAERLRERMNGRH